jgi:hypothetical protein
MDSETLIMLDRDGNVTDDGEKAETGVTMNANGVYTIHDREWPGSGKWNRVFIGKASALAIARAIIDSQDETHRAAARVLRDAQTREDS